MYYVAAGSIPRQRHTQHRDPDGRLYAEELFGVEGFTGGARSSTTSFRRPGRTITRGALGSGPKPPTTGSIATG